MTSKVATLHDVALRKAACGLGIPSNCRGCLGAVANDKLPALFECSIVGLFIAACQH